MSRKLAFVTLSIFLAAAIALAQHSPAPAGPAEGPRMVGAPPPPGVAPGVHPPAPSDGSRFAPGPPPTTATAEPGEVLSRRRTPAATATPGGPARTRRLLISRQPGGPP